MDGVHAHGDSLGRLALGKAYFGEPDLIKDAAADAAFWPGLAGTEGMDLGFGGVVLPVGAVVGAEG